MKIFTALLLSAALAAPMASIAASAHDHGSAAPQQLQLNAGKKWDTDAPLRQAMAAVHQSVTQILPAAHEGKARRYIRFAGNPSPRVILDDSVEHGVGYLVGNLVRMSFSN